MIVEKHEKYKDMAYCYHGEIAAMNTLAHLLLTTGE